MRAFVRSFLLHALSALLFVSIPPRAASDQNFDHTYSVYDNILKTHVVDGRVNYRGLENDSKQLGIFLDSAAKISKEQFRHWSEAEQLALLINLYNAATMQLIIDHYPVKSIKDIGGFFKGPWSLKVVRLFGDTITLDNLEHDIIRKRYNEPRIHMALVCAAKSCPPLRSEPYTAEKLNDQLDDQSRRFFSSPAGLAIDQKARVIYFSSIFKWYGEDFVGKFSPKDGFKGLDETERAVAHFVGLYIDPAEKAFLSAGGYKIRYLDYDWSLNAQH